MLLSKYSKLAANKGTFVLRHDFDVLSYVILEIKGPRPLTWFNWVYGLVKQSHPWHLNTHPFLKLNGGSTKPPLKLVHGWVILSHLFLIYGWQIQILRSWMVVRLVCWTFILLVGHEIDMIIVSAKSKLESARTGTVSLKKSPAYCRCK